MTYLRERPVISLNAATSSARPRRPALAAPGLLERRRGARGGRAGPRPRGPGPARSTRTRRDALEQPRVLGPCGRRAPAARRPARPAASRRLRRASWRASPSPARQRHLVRGEGQRVSGASRTRPAAARSASTRSNAAAGALGEDARPQLLARPCPAGAAARGGSASSAARPPPREPGQGVARDERPAGSCPRTTTGELGRRAPREQRASGHGEARGERAAPRRPAAPRLVDQHHGRGAQASGASLQPLDRPARSRAAPPGRPRVDDDAPRRSSRRASRRAARAGRPGPRPPATRAAAARARGRPGSSARRLEQAHAGEHLGARDVHAHARAVARAAARRAAASARRRASTSARRVPGADEDLAAREVLHLDAAEVHGRARAGREPARPSRRGPAARAPARAGPRAATSTSSPAREARPRRASR